MEKQEIENRRNAVKIILRAAVEGERIKRIVETRMHKAGVQIPDEPEEDDYDYNDKLLQYQYAIAEVDDFLAKQQDWQKLSDFSEELVSIINFTFLGEITLEEVSNYIQESQENAVDIDSISLWNCKETEKDIEYEDSLGDEDVIAYLGGKKEDFIMDDGPWSDMAANVVLEKGIRVNELPEKLLFNLSFIDKYIKQSSKLIAREREQEGITPQEIEDASSGVKLGDFKNSTTTIKETANSEQEIATDDKTIDD